MITVFIEEKKLEKSLLFSEGMTVGDAIQACGIRAVEVIPVMNDELVLESKRLRKGDRIDLLSVVSGG